MRGRFISSMSAVTALSVAACCLARPAAAEPVQRAAPAAGSVIDRKVGEEVRFVDLSNWQNVDLHQELLGGDVLRTNATGQLAVLFADRTQVRLGRNSSLQVKQMAPAGDTILNLQSGTMWARAQRGGSGLTVQTPAAAAAIRGTDWTLTVKGDQTSLIVLEGRVLLKNEHGSVEVAQGEAAVATIGQAPRKLVIVTPDDREQMLFYLTLRGGFTFMPASPLPVQKMRNERGRIEAKAPEARSAEDWLTLAEVQLSLDGRQKALESLANARSLKLSAAQRARADLIDALIAGAEKRYDEAAKLFSRAEPVLDPQRRSIAAYGSYYSRSLRDPRHAEKPPANVTGPYAAVMKAYTAGFLEDIPAAIATMKQAEARYPNDSTLPALRAQLAMLINDRIQMKEAIDRSLSIDPTDPNALQARARMRADYEGNLDGALEDLNNAIKVAPGSSTAWNDLGLLQDARGATREAEAALKKSIELDPDDPVGHANLAILYLEQSRMNEAKCEIDLALAADPAFNIAILARGRYYLQMGEREKAVDDLLASSTANPGYSQAQLMLAAGHYENGNREASSQALDNADRLDENDPSVAAFRAAVAIDDYDSEGAMKSAREYLERSRARGGYYASLGANQNGGSTLNAAFRLQGLDAWGQYYGDAVFDPFSGSSYFDQTFRGSVNPLANSFLYGGNVVTNAANASSYSSFIQGLLFDPHMLSGRSRSANLARMPFLEGSIGAGTTLTQENAGLLGEAEIQGFSNEPRPISFFANFQWEKTSDTTREYNNGTLDLNTDTKLVAGNGYVTASMTPDDRFVAFVNHSDSKYDLDIPSRAFLPLVPGLYYGLDNKFTIAGVGLSHTFGYRNVLNSAFFYSSIDSSMDQNILVPPLIPGLFSSLIHTKQENYVGAINHTYGMDDLTWRYGVEGGWIDTETTTGVSLVGVPLGEVEEHTGTRYGKVYIDLLHEITPDLKAEYGLFGTFYQGDEVDIQRLEPRIGVAWSPAEGHWLRAGYLRQGTNGTTPTLAPVGIVGLQPNTFGIDLSGYADTFTVRWDAEWNDWLFTAVDFQHQELRDLSIDNIIALESFDTSKARADRASFTANIALGYGFGLAATYALSDSEDNDPSSGDYGQELPFLPKHSGQIALTWVNEANVKATLAANYVGERHGDQSDEILDDYWTLDANLVWEPLDKRFALEAAAYNLLDEDFEVASGFNGWGRVFKGTLEIRF
ncbi:FecR family/TPR repeat domain-containing protein [Rhizobium gallicum]|uniref:FecR family/TPR repeat domain-containing protein n=1 Tax=Rhizobium gallicum TaxID=56730 RepID=A0A1L5NJ88_9HYPH|nr:FecR family/TPR repeat domain-containing protein [Rhizobium gallicum]